MEEIKSFAFFDLETTGLPEFEFFRTKITEISIIGCSKNSILNSSFDQLPRILSKLTVCVNPYKRIQDKSVELTGLSNELLEHENRFDTNTANLISSFLLQLQQPVCLIAHNGEKFDFPILQKEISKFMTLPESLRCIDSLHAFRDIDFLEDTENSIKELVESGNLSSADESSNSFTDEPISLEKSNDEIRNNNNISTDVDTSVDFLEQINKDMEINWQKINESTPRTKTIQKNSRQKRNVVPLKKVFPNCKKELFPASPRSILSKKKFTLSAIYERIHKKMPVKSHYAEDDVIALLKCSIAVKEKFVKFVEENSKLFNTVKPLGQL